MAASKVVYKLILLGDYNVGKSSIFYRFKENIFKEHTRVTVSIDNCSKTIQVDGKCVTLSLWDTVGTEKFRTLTRNYFRNSHACLLVYSVSDPSSLLGLTQWIQDTENFAESALKVIIGNKCDMNCSVDQEKLNEFAHYHDCDIVFQVSAKTGKGVDEMFQIIAQKLLMKENRKNTSQKLFEDATQDDVHSLHEGSTERPSMPCCSN